MRCALLCLCITQLALSSDALGFCHFPHQRGMRLDGAETDQRPTTNRSLRSKEFPIMVHFDEFTDPEYPLSVLAEAELAWRRLVIDLGFLPPHPDGDLGGGPEFDIYTTRDLVEGVGGYAGFSGFYEETERADAFGYLVIAEKLKSHVLQFVVYHEFFHGVQMSYDWWEDIAFMEASANWATELVRNELDVYWKFIPFFQAEPHLALDFVSIKNPYQYGMLMWPMFLEERLGTRRGDVLRRVWEASVQNEMENEPDFQDAILSIAKEHGFAHINPLLSEFSEWRLFVGSFGKFGRFFERDSWADTVTPYLEFDGYVANFPEVRDARFALQPQSSAFFRVIRTNGEAFNLRVDFENATDFSVRVIRQTSKGLEPRPIVSVESMSGVDIAIDEANGEDEVFVVISHFGEAGYDPDLSPWAANNWKFKLTRIN